MKLKEMTVNNSWTSMFHRIDCATYDSGGRGGICISINAEVRPFIINMVKDNLGLNRRIKLPQVDLPICMAIRIPDET